MSIQIITKELDGKRIAYHSDTMFYVQSRRIRNKKRYTNRYTFKGDLPRAVMHFNAINVNSEYVKRLLMEDIVLVRMQGV